jgi:hypothetical protein
VWIEGDCRGVRQSRVDESVAGDGTRGRGGIGIEGE